MKKRIAGVILCLVVLLTTFYPAAAYASDTATKTIRIGYFAFPGYHEIYKDEEGVHGRGYGFDFLQLLRKYTNLNYQYIGYEDSWQEMQDMLRAGEIDMVTSARKTSQREKEFAFSNSIGTSNAELCVRSGDDRFGLNDYSSFDGMTIGILSGNSRNGDLASLARDKGFTYQAVEYAEEAELTEALHKGEVDGIVASSLRKHTDEKIVARFALEEFYCIVRKEDTDLLDEINRGIDQMDQYEGDWRNKLFYKYTTNNLENEISFTPEELAYIHAVQSGEKSITATAQPDRDPYSYIENGELVGIIPDYFDHLMEMAELPYSVMVADDRSQYSEWAKRNTVDVYMDISLQRSTIMNENSGVFTEPYINMTMSRVTKKDFRGEIHTVAVADNQVYDGMDADLAKDVQKVVYDTRIETLQAVKDGNADACYVYTYMAEKFVNLDPSGDLIYHIVDIPVSDLAIAIRPTTDHELISILNKCMKADQSFVIDELVEQYTSHGQRDVTLLEFVQNNTWFLVAVVAVIMGVGAVIGLILRNNRNMHKVAEERAALAASLKEKNRLLEESVQQAESANVAKTTFLNNMSHDIRTPMNAIIGFTNIAMRYQTEPEVHSCLQKIGDSSEHLLTLINDVLDISRIESGKTKYTPVPVDITKVVDTVIDIMNGFLTNRNISFHVQRAKLDHPYVLADPVRIREVLVNILSNAVKFTADGGSIWFETGYEPGEDDDHIIVHYRVKDTGVGMSEEFLERVFDNYAQEENGARTQYKGTGLGMAISKQYVDLMGGNISVESKKGRGSVFTVDIPVELTGMESVVQNETPWTKKNLSGVRVLLVEDNDLNAEIAEFQLEELGMIVRRVIDGKQAVETFAESPEDSFDVILMDIMMPQMDGYEATKHIRRMENRPDGATIPIIAMTANAFAEDVQASLDAGMNGHLSKPIVIEEVVKTIVRNL